MSEPPKGPVDLLWSFRVAATGEERTSGAFGVPCALIIYAVPAPASEAPWRPPSARFARTPVHAPRAQDLAFLVGAALRLAMRAGVLRGALEAAGIPLTLPAVPGVPLVTANPWGLPPGIGPLGFPVREVSA